MKNMSHTWPFFLAAIGGTVTAGAPAAPPVWEVVAGPTPGTSASWTQAAQLSIGIRRYASGKKGAIV